MYLLKKFKHLDNNYMLVELNDKVKNNFLSSFLIGIDNKFLKLDTGDLNESTDYYKNKLNDKVMEKFDGKKFNKLNKKHLTYLADLCKMNLVIFDLNKLNLKFSTELNKKNKTVYMFKHGKKEYLLMKQNMRGMVSKLPVGIYEQFGGVQNNSIPDSPRQNNAENEIIPESPRENNISEKEAAEAEEADALIVRTTLNNDDINRIEQINLVRLADTIYELNQIEIENKINFIVSLIYDEISDEIDNINDEQRKDLEYETMLWLENNIIYNKLEIDDYVSDTDDDNNSVELETDNKQKSPMKGGINDKQIKSPYNRYEISDYVHDFEKSRSNLLLHRKFKKTYDRILGSIKGEIKGEIQNEDIIIGRLGLSSFSPENVQPQPYNDNGKMYSTKITSLEKYEIIKHLPIDKKIEKIFIKDTINPTENFKELIEKCKKIYDLIKENKCDYLQFDQGDTKKLLLETPISPNSTIGLTRLRNLPTLIDGAGSSKIDTIIDNKKDKNYTEIYNSIFHNENNSLLLTFSNVDYNKIGNDSNVDYNNIGNGSDGFKMGLNSLNNLNIPIKNGFTVDNLKEVMYNIDNNKNLNQSNEILDLINTTNNDKDYKLQILRKLKFIGDRGQIVSAMKDNENNFTSRTLLGSGDRIFIAYALEQQEPIIFSNQFITRLYVPNILPNSQQLKIIEQNLLRKNTSTDYNNKPKEYADAIFEKFLEKNFQQISDNITLSPIEITITNEEIKELIMSSILSFINEQFSSNGYIIRFRNEIINVDKIQYDGSIISNINYNNYLNTNINKIIEFIIKVANSNTENTRKRKRKEDNNTEKRKKRLYQKLNELETRYLSGLFGTDRKTSIKNLDETEYNLFKIRVFETIIKESNNIESEISKVLNENIKNLFDFKKKATESIEIIKSYKEEVKNALGENASRIMNETKLLEYIKKPENQQSLT